MKLTIFLVFAIVVAASATNYCTKCANHVGCNNNGRFQGNCPGDAYIVPMSSSAIQTLLNAHNEVRNKIAGGGQPGFSRASKMMTVKWDSELAYLAELNVRKCKMEHDGCIQTDKYPVAGQNLAWSGAKPNHDSNVNKVLSDAVHSWYNEVKDANQGDINSCCGGSKFMKIGHFTQVVRDRVVAIGCAASRYTSDWKVTLIACNYSYGNMMGTPVYFTGNTASQCPNGRDSVFGNLCRS